MISHGVPQGQRPDLKATPLPPAPGSLELGGLEAWKAGWLGSGTPRTGGNVGVAGCWRRFPGRRGGLQGGKPGLGTSNVSHSRLPPQGGPADIVQSASPSGNS